MDYVKIGDVVGWRFSLGDGRNLEKEVTGTIVAIHGNYLAIKSRHITCLSCDPFHSRHRNHCHLIESPPHVAN